MSDVFFFHGRHGRTHALAFVNLSYTERVSSAYNTRAMRYRAKRNLKVTTVALLLIDSRSWITSLSRDLHSINSMQYGASLE